MKGRIYDPNLGRFLQADPHVQAPLNSQNYNRYSYVLNNPMSYTDPSGYFFKKLGKFVKKYWRVIAAAAATYVTAGAASGWAASWAAGAFGAGTTAATVAAGALTGAIAGAAGGFVATGTLKGTLTGALSGAVFGGIGGYGKAMSWGKDAFVAAHSFAGGVLAELQGGKFGHGFVTAGIMKAAGVAVDGTSNLKDITKTLVMAIAGGTVSKITGSKFANGAVTSAIQFVVNQQQSGNTASGTSSSTNILGKIWNLPNTILGLAFGTVGHVAGWIMGTNPYIDIGNNAIQFHNNPLMPSAMTLGNVIVYGRAKPNTYNQPFKNSPQGYTVGDEERMHTKQGEILGPLYFPAHVIGGVTSLFSAPHPGLVNPHRIDGWHRNNFMETGPMSGKVF